MPVSTTHRLVTELAEWGLLERTHESRFRVGGPIRAIGSRVSYSPRIIELARRVLDDLAATVRTSARLGVLAGTKSLISRGRSGGAAAVLGNHQADAGRGFTM